MNSFWFRTNCCMASILSCPFMAGVDVPWLVGAACNCKCVAGISSALGTAHCPAGAGSPAALGVALGFADAIAFRLGLLLGLFWERHAYNGSRTRMAKLEGTRSSCRARKPLLWYEISSSSFGFELRRKVPLEVCQRSRRARRKGAGVPKSVLQARSRFWAQARKFGGESEVDLGKGVQKRGEGRTKTTSAPLLYLFLQ